LSAGLCGCAKLWARVQGLDRKMCGVRLRPGERGWAAWAPPLARRMGTRSIWRE